MKNQNQNSRKNIGLCRVIALGGLLFLGLFGWLAQDKIAIAYGETEQNALRSYVDKAKITQAEYLMAIGKGNGGVYDQYQEALYCSDKLEARLEAMKNLRDSYKQLLGETKSTEEKWVLGDTTANNDFVSFSVTETDTIEQSSASTAINQQVAQAENIMKEAEEVLKNCLKVFSDPAKCEDEKRAYEEAVNLYTALKEVQKNYQQLSQKNKDDIGQDSQDEGEIIFENTDEDDSWQPTPAEQEIINNILIEIDGSLDEVVAEFRASADALEEAAIALANEGYAEEAAQLLEAARYFRDAAKEFLNRGSKLVGTNAISGGSGGKNTGTSNTSSTTTSGKTSGGTKLPKEEDVSSFVRWLDRAAADMREVSDKVERIADPANSALDSIGNIADNISATIDKATAAIDSTLNAAKKLISALPFGKKLLGLFGIDTSGPALDGPGLTEGFNKFKVYYKGNKYSSAIGMIVGWVNFALPFVSLIAIVALIYAGFLYLTAAGNQEQTDKAKKIIIWVIIGIVIILIAYALVSTLISGDSST